MTLHILLVGKICGDEFSWDISPLPVEEREPVDGSLQDMADIANADAMAEEWREEWLEQEFFDHYL